LIHQLLAAPARKGAVAKVDTILIGRNTFEVVLKLPNWPCGDKRVVSSEPSPAALSEITGRVEQMRGEPAESRFRKSILHEYSLGTNNVQKRN
jgi:hypothetical protein